MADHLPGSMRIQSGGCTPALAPNTLTRLLAQTQVADAMIVEGSAYEDMASKGRMRTQGYLVRQVCGFIWK